MLIFNYFITNDLSVEQQLGFYMIIKKYSILNTLPHENTFNNILGNNIFETYMYSVQSWHKSL